MNWLQSDLDYHTNKHIQIYIHNIICVAKVTVEHVCTKWNPPLYCTRTHEHMLSPNFNIGIMNTTKLRENICTKDHTRSTAKDIKLI